MNEQHLNGAAPVEAEGSFPTGDRVNGRPPLRSKEIEETILRRIRQGKSLVEICDDPALPCRDTIHTWLQADEERKLAKGVSDGEVLFVDRYAIAARIRASGFQEEILSISDDGRNDTYKDAKGNVAINYDHIQRSKLRVETRKWLMAKLEPKKWGDRPSEVHLNQSVSGVAIMSREQQERLQQRNQQALRR